MTSRRSCYGESSESPKVKTILVSTHMRELLPSRRDEIKSMSRTTEVVPEYRSASPMVWPQIANCVLYSASASRCCSIRWKRLYGFVKFGPTSYPRSSTVFAMNAARASSLGKHRTVGLHARSGSVCASGNMRLPCTYSEAPIPRGSNPMISYSSPIYIPPFQT